MTLDTTDTALDILAKASYDPKYGARPVRRAIQDMIEDPLTMKYLDGYFKDGDIVKIIKKGDGVDLLKAEEVTDHGRQSKSVVKRGKKKEDVVGLKWGKRIKMFSTFLVLTLLINKYNRSAQFLM